MLESGIDFFRFLEKRIESPLPGIKSHLKLLPPNSEARLKPVNYSKRESAVMVLFDEQMNILLTLRPTTIKTHPNQISFPGGKSEKNETIINTALRETEEEIGLLREQITAILQIPLTKLYIPPSDSLVYPIIGYINNFPKMYASPAEVEKIILLPITKIINREYTEHRFVLSENSELSFPAWNINERVPLWGATAMILSEIIDLFSEYIQHNIESYH